MKKFRDVKNRVRLVCCVFIGFCAFSSADASIIEGFSEISPYAGIVNAEGTMKNLSFDLSVSGVIYSVAMNGLGAGLMGGTNSITGDFYVMRVAPDGTTTAISSLSGKGIIYSVAINALGAGLIGGANPAASMAYAALVDPDGTLTDLLLPSNAEFINSVAINDSGNGLIGGGFSSGTSYAALVAPNGELTDLSPCLPLSTLISSVAINKAGIGLIGGRSGPSFYSAIVSSGTVTPSLPPSSPAREFGTVAIINQGADSIKEVNSDTSIPYAAFVSSDGTVMVLESPSFPAHGEFDSVAISDEGVGLIGKVNDDISSFYAALVAPDGTVTDISWSLPLFEEINCFENTEHVLSSVVPESFGPYSSLANVMFDLNQVLEGHYIIHHKNESFKKLTNSLRSEKNNSDKIDLFSNSRSGSGVTKHNSTHGGSCSKNKSCCRSSPYSFIPQEKKDTISFWSSLFGNYDYQRAEEKIPAFSNEIAGALVAAECELQEDRNLVIGGGLAYAFNYVHYAAGIGHAAIHQELAVVYGSINKNHFFVNLAAWGGGYQMDNKRRSLYSITSKANLNGYLFCPHLELSVPCYLKDNDWFLLEPFGILDWANNWQSSFREYGKSGFNIALQSQYSSVLRSEIGIRLYEILRYRWGNFIMEEKLSYVNKTPFNTGASSAFFVGAISSFGIETFSSKIQNLGVAQLSCNLLPSNLKYPYGSLNFQAEGGSSFQAYTLILNIIKDF